MKKYILQTKNITKSFGRYTALNNISISLEQGKVYGLIGQNGAGKTTLMRLIAGLRDVYKRQVLELLLKIL